MNLVPLNQDWCHTWGGENTQFFGMQAEKKIEKYVFCKKGKKDPNGAKKSQFW